MSKVNEATLQQMFTKGEFSPAPVHDVQRGKLWDTYVHPGGPLPRQFHLFSRSLTETANLWPSAPVMPLSNMQHPKRLPAPAAFAINTINFMFTEASLETELAFADSSSWTFYTGCKWHARSSLAMMQIGSYAELDVLRKCNYCERVHVQLSCPGCGSAQFSVLTSSIEQPLTSFDTASISLPSFKLKCWFDGFHARGIQ